jgi:hypothetical protein
MSGRGDINRRNRARAYQAEARLQSERRRFDRHGIHPGDAYRGLWLYYLDMKEKLAAAKSEEDRRYFQREMALTLHRIMPYERPKLTTVKVQGDANAPVVSPEAFAEALAKTLTIAELELLDAVALKLVGVPGMPAIEGTAVPAGAPAQRVKAGATPPIAPAQRTKGK